MKLVNTLNPKRIAAYITIACAASFFIVGCDNSTTDKVENSVVNSQQISNEQLPDFIKNSFNNFILNYNLKQNFATVSLDSFTPSTDNKEITMVIGIALSNLDYDSEQPIVINSTYIITPEQSSTNNVVATFSLQKSVFADDQSILDKNSFSSFIKQLIDNIGLTDNGSILVSGDIKSVIKTNNTFNYTNDDSYEINSLSIKPLIYNYQTKNNMALVDINYQLPSIDFSVNGLVGSFKNVDAQELNHLFNDKFTYSGQDLYKIDSIDINYQKTIKAQLHGVTSQVRTELSDNGLINQYLSTSFSGDIINSVDKKINLIVNGNAKVEHINLEALQNWTDYVQSRGFAFGGIDSTKITLLTKIFKDGFSLAINDTNVELDGAKGYLDFNFKIEPMDISETIKPNILMTQMINNISIQVNSIVPLKWFDSLGMINNRNNLDLVIKQAIQQIDAIGYKGAVTYDGQNISVNFDIKKGNVFVNGDLKGSLFNTLSLFM